MHFSTEVGPPTSLTGHSGRAPRHRATLCSASCPFDAVTLPASSPMSGALPTVPRLHRSQLAVTASPYRKPRQGAVVWHSLKFSRLSLHPGWLSPRVTKILCSLFPNSGAPARCWLRPVTASCQVPTCWETRLFYKHLLHAPYSIRNPF
jgi:hypothetical protein